MGMWGLWAGEARREGFSPVSARIEARAKARYFGGRSTTVELTADQKTGRLLGGVVTGEQGVAGRLNVIAGARRHGIGGGGVERGGRGLFARPSAGAGVPPVFWRRPPAPQ